MYVEYIKREYSYFAVRFDRLLDLFVGVKLNELRKIAAVTLNFCFQAAYLVLLNLFLSLGLGLGLGLG